MQQRDYWVLKNITKGKQSDTIVYAEDNSLLVSKEVAPFFLRRFDILSGNEFRFQEYSITGYNSWHVVSGTEFEHEHINNQHKHNFFEMMIVLDGEIEVYIGNGVYHYRKGDICLLNRNTRHNDIFKGGQEILYVCFTSDFLDEWPISYANYTKRKTSVSSFFQRNMDKDVINHKEYMDFYLKPNHSVDEVLTITNSMQNELLVLVYNYGHGKLNNL